jgi:hypothetical protein
VTFFRFPELLMVLLNLAGCVYLKFLGKPGTRRGGVGQVA